MTDDDKALVERLRASAKADDADGFAMRKAAARIGALAAERDAALAREARLREAAEFVLSDPPVEYDCGEWFEEGLKALRAALATPAPEALAAIRREAAAKMRQRAANVALNACLVDPDGGNPTEAERLVCEEAWRRIRALPLPGGDA